MGGPRVRDAMADRNDGDRDQPLETTVAEAASAVLDADPDAERAAVESALETIAEDGVITGPTLTDAVGTTAQYVSTPENRLELTARALESARQAAEPAPDVPVVEARLDPLVARFEALEADLDSLLDRLSSLTADARDPTEVHAVAREVDHLRDTARDLHARAEELRSDLESFERWVTEPDRRNDALRADLDAVAERVERVEATLDGAGPDAGEDWARAVVEHRVIALLLEDLAAESAALRRWPGEAFDDTVADRLSRLVERHDRLEAALDDAARDEWRERYGDRLAAVSDALSPIEPPIDWGAVRARLEDHAPGLA